MNRIGAIALAACVVLSLAALPRPIPTGTTSKALRDEIALLDGQIVTLNAQVASLTAQLGTLPAQVSSLQAANAQLTSDLNAANTTIASKTAEVTSLQSTLDSTLATLATQTATLSQVQVDLADCNVEALAFVPKQAALDAFQSWLVAQKAAQDALADAGVVVPE